MTLDKATVLASLRAEDVVRHFSIPGVWRGRWLRSRRCAQADHNDMAFGVSAEGKFHCWSCGTGGDLLRLIALGSKLDLTNDFPAVLAVAAEIAGVRDEESFGGSDKPKPVARPELSPLPSLEERIALAKRRAAWVWDRLVKREDMPRSAADLYLTHERKLDPVGLRKLEDLRETPLRVNHHEASRSEDMQRLTRLFAIPGLALPVRAVDDGRLVDVRVRRFEPKEDQPKIIGMLGGVTVGEPESRHGSRRLVGCYGHPECIDPGPSKLVVVVEGAADYLTGLCVWPDAQVLGAVDAGSMNLVAEHAAKGLANYPGGLMLIVEQADPPKLQADGTMKLGAADRSVNEDVNAASKRAIRILGPRRVGWLHCGVVDHATKDLNDLVRIGLNPVSMVRWWSDMGEAVTP